MNAFELLPRKWYSPDYIVVQSGIQLTSLKFSSGPERGAFTLQGVAYLARKESWSSSKFFLHRDRIELAQAEKPSWAANTFTLRYEGVLYTLKSSSKSFVLLRDGTPVGTIAKRGWFTKRATAELPEDFSLPVAIFIIWLALSMWKRAEDSTTVACLAVTTSS